MLNVELYNEICNYLLIPKNSTVDINNNQLDNESVILGK